MKRFASKYLKGLFVEKGRGLFCVALDIRTVTGGLKH